jgi:hypothetical protein
VPYRVVVSDLSPAAGRAAPRVLGEFASAAQAVAACRAVVEAALQGLRQPGWGADDLFLAYTVQGPDAYVVGPPGESVGFSAWRHARERSLQWCEGRGSLPWLDGPAPGWRPGANADVERHGRVPVRQGAG